jgi:hypothetical protein
MTQPMNHTDPIDQLLAEAAQAPAPALPPAFAARLLADAKLVPAAPPPPRPGFLARAFAWVQPVGGAAGVAGLALAALTGLWLGFAGITPADAFVVTLQQGGDGALVDLLARDDAWEMLP